MQDWVFKDFGRKWRKRCYAFKKSNLIFMRRSVVSGFMWLVVLTIFVYGACIKRREKHMCYLITEVLNTQLTNKLDKSMMTGVG